MRQWSAARVSRYRQSAFSRLNNMVTNIMFILVILVVSINVIQSWSFSTRSTMWTSRNSQSTMLGYDNPSFSCKRSLLRVGTELHHSTGNNEDKPYLQHVCPSCSYVYDESKGFKKRHPPGRALCNITGNSYFVQLIWSSSMIATVASFLHLDPSTSHYAVYLPFEAS